TSSSTSPSRTASIRAITVSDLQGWRSIRTPASFLHYIPAPFYSAAIQTALYSRFSRKTVDKFLPSCDFPPLLSCLRMLTYLSQNHIKTWLINQIAPLYHADSQVYFPSCHFSHNRLATH